MPTTWKTTAAAATIAAALMLAACSSSRSPAPAKSSKSGGGGGLKAVSNCLSSHGADPSSLTGLLAGSPITATPTQLSALRTASKACESSVPAKIKSGLSSTVTCLDQRGYHLDQNAPLSALFSLDLAQPTVTAALTGCSATLPNRKSKSAGS